MDHDNCKEVSPSWRLPTNLKSSLSVKFSWDDATLLSAVFFSPYYFPSLLLVSSNVSWFEQLIYVQSSAKVASFWSTNFSSSAQVEEFQIICHHITPLITNENLQVCTIEISIIANKIDIICWSLRTRSEQ